MSPDRHWVIGLFLLGIVSLVMVLYFFIGFSGITRPMISEGASSVGNYTANVTAWSGFSSTFSAAPLLIVIIFFGLIAYALWRLVGSHVQSGKGG